MLGLTGRFFDSPLPRKGKGTNKVSLHKFERPALGQHLALHRVDLRRDVLGRFSSKQADVPLGNGFRSGLSQYVLDGRLELETGVIRLDGQEEPTDLVISRVIPGFFENLDIDVVRGRTFVASDTSGTAIQTHAAARSTSVTAPSDDERRQKSRCQSHWMRLSVPRLNDK